MRGESLNTIWLALILAVLLVGCSGAPSPSSGLHSGDATRRLDTGVVLSLTDIHFDPFYDPILFPELVRSAPAEWTRIFESSQVTGYGDYGKDSNYNLFVSALRHAARAAPEAEIILLAGDWLAHGFADTYYEHAGNRDPQGLYEFIDKTIAFVTQRIREQFPYTALYPALGNEDSYCGDYELQPGGEFLRRTADTWKALFDDGDNERAFMRTFPRGGYYTVSAPGTPKHRVIVLNTVFFSASYSNQCGDSKDDPAGEEIRWLAAQLKDAAAKDEKVWLLYHIPPGIDAFGTATATSGTTVVPLWQAGYLESFLALLDQYRATIVFTLAGHTHADDFRLALDSWTSHSSFLVVTPSISPVFGNNPGLQVLSYDRKSILGAGLRYPPVRLGPRAFAALARGVPLFSGLSFLPSHWERAGDSFPVSPERRSDPRDVHPLLQRQQHGRPGDHRPDLADLLVRHRLSESRGVRGLSATFLSALSPISIRCRTGYQFLGGGRRRPE